MNETNKTRDVEVLNYIDLYPAGVVFQVLSLSYKSVSYGNSRITPGSMTRKTNTFDFMNTEFEKVKIKSVRPSKKEDGIYIKTENHGVFYFF